MTPHAIVHPAPTAAPYAPPPRGAILVAVAGTDDPTRDDVLRSAALLAMHAGAPLVVLVVAEPLPSYLLGAETVAYVPLEDEQAHAAALLDDARAAARAVLDPALAVSYRVMIGEPARSIAQAAREADAALIIVGIGHHGVLDRLLGGETALRVMKLADRPVLAVARAFATLPTRVMVAVDFAPSSTRAAEAVLPYLAPKASLTFVHVWHRAPFAGPEFATGEDAFERSLMPALARLGRSVGVLVGAELHTVTLEGPTVERLLAFARSADLDLIAVGRRSHSWVDRLFVGSVTSALVRAAPCAVLVTPEPDATEQDRLRRLAQGVSERMRPADWPAQIDAFSRRNEGRSTVLEEDDPELGAQTVATGLPLLGATYNPRDCGLELMLGHVGPAGRRLAHGVGGVESVGILVGDDGVDRALAVRHDGGQTLLTFRD